MLSRGRARPIDCAAWSLCAIAILLLIADCVILGYSAGVIRPPWYPEELARAKTVGEKVLDLYLSQIEERVEEDKALLSQIISQARDSLAHSDSFIAVAEALWEAGADLERVDSLSSTRERGHSSGRGGGGESGSALTARLSFRCPQADRDAVGASSSMMGSLLNDDDLTGISRIAAEHDLVGVVDIRSTLERRFRSRQPPSGATALSKRTTSGSQSPSCPFAALRI